VSDDNGTSAPSRSRRAAGMFVIASYEPVPFAAHSQTWRAR
jgi:hypothetical protein